MVIEAVSQKVNDFDRARQFSLVTASAEPRATRLLIRDAAISSLSGIEADVLTRVMQAKTPTPPIEAVSMLAAAVAKSGDVAAVQRAIDVIANASLPDWQRTALLQGLIKTKPGTKVVCVLSGGNVNLDQLKGLRWN